MDGIVDNDSLDFRELLDTSMNRAQSYDQRSEMVK